MTRAKFLFRLRKLLTAGQDAPLDAQLLDECSVPPLSQASLEPLLHMIDDIPAIGEWTQADLQRMVDEDEARALAQQQAEQQQQHLDEEAARQLSPALAAVASSDPAASSTAPINVSPAQGAAHQALVFSPTTDDGQLAAAAVGEKSSPLSAVVVPLPSATSMPTAPTDQRILLDGLISTSASASSQHGGSTLPGLHVVTAALSAATTASSDAIPTGSPTHVNGIMAAEFHTPSVAAPRSMHAAGPDGAALGKMDEPLWRAPEGTGSYTTMSLDLTPASAAATTSQTLNAGTTGASTGGNQHQGSLRARREKWH